MRFEREIDIHSPKEKVWRFLWDIDRFIACVPGCKEAGTLEAGKSYTATMVEKVGPFRVEFPMRIDVLESREHSYIKAQASGSDSKIGSRMKVELEVNLTGEGDQTKLLLGASVDILGKLATLGHSMIKRKADQVMDEFAGNLKQKLEADA
ncbi:MAG TPA: SRPBCC domain-containing protein [Verrucomicrobiae bacterium]|nr:SRPBCC domain-containing protein [Verrucomicrobiae bacterium]